MYALSGAWLVTESLLSRKQLVWLRSNSERGEQRGGQGTARSVRVEPGPWVGVAQDGMRSARMRGQAAAGAELKALSQGDNAVWRRWDDEVEGETSKIVRLGRQGRGLNWERDVMRCDVRWWWRWWWYHNQGPLAVGVMVLAPVLAPGAGGGWARRVLGLVTARHADDGRLPCLQQRAGAAVVYLRSDLQVTDSGAAAGVLCWC